MLAPTARYLTALAAVSMCATTIFRGIELQTSIHAEVQGTDQLDQEEILLPSLEHQGVFVSARETMPDQPNLNSEKDIGAQHQRITKLLASRPLSSALWLSFAESLREDAQTPEKIVR